MEKENGRIEWIDYAKGLAMVLVIAGHTFDGGIRGVIFSFHMPLFFLLSGLTYKPANSLGSLYKGIKKSFMHLVFPAIVVFLLCSFYQLIVLDTEPLGEYLIKRINTLIYASGSNIKSGDIITVERIGVIWFLVALFIGRNLYDWLQLYLKRIVLATVVCCFLVVGVLIGNKIWPPLSFDISLVVVFYIWIGQELKKYQITSGMYNLSFFIIPFAIWVISFILCYHFGDRYLELSQRRYPLFPLCIVCSLAGSLFFCELSCWLQKKKILNCLVCYLGRNSLYFLCIHAVDEIWMNPIQILVRPTVFVFLARLFLDFFVFVILLKTLDLYKKTIKS